jgi:hypothetical protein
MATRVLAAVEDGTVVLTASGGKETLQAHGNLGATETIDLALGNVHTGTLDANCTFTFTGATNGLACAFYLRLTQDGTGSRTITWPGSVKWAGGVAPILSTGAGKVSALAFETTDGGTTWYGFLAGDDLR